MLKTNQLKYDCRFFRGDIPCKPHKQFSVHCVDETGNNCKYYDPIKEKILIIKLGATGDVIRTTPILSPLKKQFPNSKIFWLTLSPAVVPEVADVVLDFNLANIEFLKAEQFNLLINLDKDKEACALANQISAKEKKGFVLKNGIPSPVNPHAEHKYLTGIFDDYSTQNTKNYMVEMFEILGYNYNGEKYILPDFKSQNVDWDLDRKKKVIGLNTGCGGRWTSRLWKDEYWIELAKSLLNNNYEVLFLGGEQEDEKNKMFAQKSGGKYFGHFSLGKFINLVDQCDLVVTAVTMAMHITLGLNKKIILFNNIFNKHEFELFGLGEIIEPEKECTCFYKPTCTNTNYRCMDLISVAKVFDSIKILLAK
ncbi:MAG: glycosyltransferase family 9 protein [Ignavibacteriales bacterium]|nr:glycosyltransferase family 9 protein [Ignavibacteriales bacterium]